MYRRSSQNTRNANAEEKRWHAWLKEQPCCQCHKPGPSIVEHCVGSTFKHQKQLIGHLFCIPLCSWCDSIKTRGGRPRYWKMFGERMCESWKRVIDDSPFEPPPRAAAAIMDWNR